MKTLEVETVDPNQSQAIAIRPQEHVSLFGASEPVAIIERATSVATALKSVIQAQKLISNISGKEYPRCEAWTLLGTMLGVFPVLCWTKPVEEGWEARVEARTRDGAVVGAAEAECLRTERNWSNRDDFAIRSMAQTRATAKALRMPLGFVMTLAGYEATPAEEMTFEKEPRNSNTRGMTGGNHNSGAGGFLPSVSKVTDSANEISRAARTVPSTGKCATVVQRDRMIEELLRLYPQDDLLTYARSKSILMPSESGEGLGDWPLRFVPSMKSQMDLLLADLTDFFEGAGTNLPAFVNPEPVTETEKAKPVEVPRDQGTGTWRQVEVPFGKNKGKPLGELDNRQLRAYAGLALEDVASPTFTGRDGKERQKSPAAMAKAKEWLKHLQAAAAEMGFTVGGEE